MSKRLSLGALVLLFFAFLLYSTIGVFSKLTSTQVFMSKGSIYLFSLVIVAMGGYAIMWQMVLKFVPLTQAYLFKSSTVIFSLMYAFFLFREHISFQNILGAFFIMAGIITNSLSK